MSTRQEIQDLTLATIRQQRAEYGAKRAAITAELVAIHGARQAGRTFEPAPMPPSERAARDRAKTMLNGHSPAWLTAPSAVSRESELMIELAAIDLVLKALQDDEVEAEAVATVAYAERVRPEYRTLAREILLAAVRLQTLEARAAELLRPCGVGQVRMEMGHTLAQGSVLGAEWDWGSDPLRFAREEALAEGIVTKSDLRKAAE